MIDPKIQELLTYVGNEIGRILDDAIDKAEMEQMHPCAVFEGLSHVLTERVGELEIIHLEGDLTASTQDLNAKIDKDLLTKTLGTIQVNVIQSLTTGMNLALESGGHYTLKQLKDDLMSSIKKEIPSKAKKDDDDNSGGKTFH